MNSRGLRRFTSMPLVRSGGRVTAKSRVAVIALRLERSGDVDAGVFGGAEGYGGSVEVSAVFGIQETAHARSKASQSSEKISRGSGSVAANNPSSAETFWVGRASPSK
jgi:hypothetical protein